jgi:hypothetical protein
MSPRAAEAGQMRPDSDDRVPQQGTPRLLFCSCHRSINYNHAHIAPPASAWNLPDSPVPHPHLVGGGVVRPHLQGPASPAGRPARGLSLATRLHHPAVISSLCAAEVRRGWRSTAPPGRQSCCCAESHFKAHAPAANSCIHSPDLHPRAQHHRQSGQGQQEGGTAPRGASQPGGERGGVGKKMREATQCHSTCCLARRVPGTHPARPHRVHPPPGQRLPVLDQILQLAGDRRLVHVLDGQHLLDAKVCGGARDQGGCSASLAAWPAGAAAASCAALWGGWGRCGVHVAAGIRRQRCAKRTVAGDQLGLGARALPN